MTEEYSQAPCPESLPQHFSLPAGMEEHVINRCGSVPIIHAPLPAEPQFCKGKQWSVWEYRGMVVKWLKRGSEEEQNERIASVVPITCALEFNGLTAALLAILWNKDMALRGICVKKAMIPGKSQMDTEEFHRYEAAITNAAETLCLHRTPTASAPSVDSFLKEARQRINLGVLDDKIVLIDIDGWCRSGHAALQDAGKCVLDRLCRATQAKR